MAASRAQIRAIVDAAMVAAGFRARGTVDALNMPHKHNDCLIDGIFTAIESFHYKAFYDPSSALPDNPVIGDVYIAATDNNGWNEDFIYSWDGTAWDETAPVEGMFVWIDDEDTFYKYNGTAWSEFTATIGDHYHDYLVSPGTDVPKFYVDLDGGFVFVAPDGARWKFIFSATAFAKLKWSGTEWIDLDDTLRV